MEGADVGTGAAEVGADVKVGGVPENCCDD